MGNIDQLVRRLTAEVPSGWAPKILDVNRETDDYASIATISTKPDVFRIFVDASWYGREAGEIVLSSDTPAWPSVRASVTFIFDRQNQSDMLDEAAMWIGAAVRGELYECRRAHFIAGDIRWVTCDRANGAPLYKRWEWPNDPRRSEPLRKYASYWPTT